MKHKRGFTLVEVLVAIAIFAVLSAAGWRVFDQLIQTRERNHQHAQHILQLQTAYNQLLRDVQQIIPVAGKLGANEYPALVLQRELLQLNRSGVIDPLQQGLDTLEFVEYGYDSQKQALVRYKSPYIYRQDVQLMQADVVLAPVSEVRFQALDPDVQDQWPSQLIVEADAKQFMLTKLPKGIALNFNYRDQEYRWVFALTKNLNIEAAQQPTQPAGESNDE